MSLLDVLNKKNISQYQLAKKSGLPKSTISDICNNENGIDNCKLSTVKKIAYALNYTLDELIYEINNEDRNQEITMDVIKKHVKV